MNNIVQFDQATNNKLRSEAPVQVGQAVSFSTSSDPSAASIRGPFKPISLLPLKARAAFSRNSFAADWTDCF